MENRWTQTQEATFAEERRCNADLATEVPSAHLDQARRDIGR